MGLRYAAEDRNGPLAGGSSRKRKARKGKDAGLEWADVVAKYADVVYTMAYRLTGDDEEARDLAQDVLIRLHRALRRYKEGNFEGWLYRTTLNAFRDRLRKRKRLREDELPDEPPSMRTSRRRRGGHPAEGAARRGAASTREASSGVSRGRRAA